MYLTGLIRSKKYKCLITRLEDSQAEQILAFAISVVLLHRSVKES